MKRIINVKKGKDGRKAHKRTYEYAGSRYKIKKSTRMNKDLMAVNVETGNKVHFGDPNMGEFPGTSREDNFCARSYGIKDKQGKPTRNDPKSANFWNRRITWSCRGKVSSDKKSKYERCVKAVKKQGKAYNPYSVCQASLGGSD
jgi:hypothetical protein